MPKVTQKTVKIAEYAKEYTHGSKEEISRFKQAGKG